MANPAFKNLSPKKFLCQIFSVDFFKCLPDLLLHPLFIPKEKRLLILLFIGCFGNKNLIAPAVKTKEKG
jgi:hypothetical protein